MLKRIFVFVWIAALAPSVSAQISHGGSPHYQGKNTFGDLEFFVPARPDIEALQIEDLALDPYESIPYRFGANIPVDLGSDTDGLWTVNAAGDRVWRLAIHSPGAVSLNFQFDEYDLPEGARVFVYSPDQSEILGSFTRANAGPENSLGVGLLAGDRLIIEYFEPAKVAGQGRLHIDQITHGYRDIFGRGIDIAKGQFGNSGPCNINVNCPEGLPFNFQKRSVALIVNNGNSVCSGALVNNTAQDNTPFFLTANHCVPGNSSGVNNWVFYFNYESPTCDGNNGPVNQSISGSTFLARNAYSDFALLELNEAPPSSFNVCFSGWDATDLENSVTNAYGIHHPAGDVKKICFEEDAPYHDQVSWINAVWFIDNWESGVTEGGSSGSPLFNQQGVIIGQLGGGSAQCSSDTTNNGGFDYYGRFGTSWAHGDQPSNALRFWLDPGNTGVLIMPNSCGGSMPENSVAIADIVGATETRCNTAPFIPSVQVVNTGGNEVTSMALSIASNGGQAQVLNWAGSLLGGQQVSITSATIAPLDGMNNVVAEVTAVNGVPVDGAESTFSAQFMAIENPAYVDIHIVFDDYSEETGWNISDSDGNLIHYVTSYPSETIETTESVCLGSGCYIFTITDQYGDGICCNYGQGSYTVLSSEGDTLASGGAFGEAESTEICLVLDTFEFSTPGGVAVYPNPAEGYVFIGHDNSTASNPLRSIRIFDISGRLVAEKPGLNGNDARMDVSALQSGAYVVEVVMERGYARKKLVIQRK